MERPNSTLTRNAVAVVSKLLKKDPTSIGTRDARWHARGSLVVTFEGPKAGLWYDHERGEGGTLPLLIARECGIRGAEATALARAWSQTGNFSAIGRAPSPLNDHKHRDNRAFALRLWQEATPIAGTGAERYLAGRGLAVPDGCSPRVIRWHQASREMIALMTDPVTGQATGIHRTRLDEHDRKRERKMLGRQGVVRISADEDVTIGLAICEGVEDALAILACGWEPVWAATSAGAIARFPVLTGIEALTIVSDADDAGSKAAEACAARWRAAGHDARIVPGGCCP